MSVAERQQAQLAKLKAMRGLVAETEVTAATVCAELAKQRGQIERMTSRVDEVQGETARATQLLKGLHKSLATFGLL